MLKALGCALLQLAHPGGLLHFLRENLVQLHPAPLDDLPLDLRRGFFMSDQQDALELTLAELVQLLQEDAAVEELLVKLKFEVYCLVLACNESNKLRGFSWISVTSQKSSIISIFLFYFTGKYIFLLTLENYFLAVL